MGAEYHYFQLKIRKLSLPRWNYSVNSQKVTDSGTVSWPHLPTSPSPLHSKTSQKNYLHPVLPDGPTPPALQSTTSWKLSSSRSKVSRCRVQWPVLCPPTCFVSSTWPRWCLTLNAPLCFPDTLLVAPLPHWLLHLSLLLVSPPPNVDMLAWPRVQFSDLYLHSLLLSELTWPRGFIFLLMPMIAKWESPSWPTPKLQIHITNSTVHLSCCHIQLFIVNPLYQVDEWLFKFFKNWIFSGWRTES